MMEHCYARDLLHEHIAGQQSLDAKQVAGIVDAGVADEGDFEERLPGQFWYSSEHEPFPEGWTQEDQDEANGD